ncbi:MAG: hypothetical protein R3D63_05050 [Paracoccaceae bacterium]
MPEPIADPSPILTLTLNPALDMATEVAEIIPGQKLRCSDPLLDPGGGGRTSAARSGRWAATAWRWWPSAG